MPLFQLLPSITELQNPPTALAACWWPQPVPSTGAASYRQAQPASTATTNVVWVPLGTDLSMGMRCASAQAVLHSCGRYAQRLLTSCSILQASLGRLVRMHWMTRECLCFWLPLLSCPNCAAPCRAEILLVAFLSACLRPL